MPTETYFRLPEQKREKIRQAIHKEFARVPYEDVSINRVVHDASIPRGSFYQYFDGREDMFRYLLQEYHDRFLRFASEDLDRYHNEPYEFILMIYDKIVAFVRSGSEDLAFCRNLLSNMRFKDMGLFLQFFAKYREEYRGYVVTGYRTAFKDTSDEGVLLASEILQSALQQSLCRLLAPNAPENTPEDYAAERERLERKLQLIRCGLEGKESEC